MAKDHALSAALPKTDLNSIPDHLKELLDKPAERRVAICLLDVDSIKHKIATGVDLATIRLLSIELIPDGERATAAREMARECYQERTGKLELDFSTEQADDDADED